MSDKKVKNTTTKNEYFLFVSLILVCAMLIVIMRLPKSAKSIDADYLPPTTITSNVELVYPDDKVVSVKLPSSVSNEQEFMLRLDLNDIPDLNYKAININIAYLAMDLIMDGKIFYSYKPDENAFIKSGGSNFHLVCFPREINDKTLLIHFKPLLEKNDKYRLNPIVIGYRSQIITSYQVQDGFQILLSIFLIVISLVIFVYNVFAAFNNDFNKNLMYMAFISLNIGHFVIVQPWLIFYYIRNNLILYVYKYSSMAILATPILLLARDKVDKKFVKLLDSLIFLSILNLTIQTICVFSGISEYREFRVVTLLIITASLIALSIALFFTDKKEYPEARNLLYSFIPMILSFVVGTLSYVFYVDINYYLTLAIGVTFFMIMQIILILKYYIKKNNEVLKMEFYKEAAFVDPLSRCKTRASLENKREWLYSDKNKFDSLVVLLVDLNDLKRINDRFGHNAGDMLISGFGSILSNVTTTFDNADVYRIGGDEFLILVSGVDEKIVLSYIEKINNFVEIYNSSNIGREISFAFGNSFSKDIKNDDLDKLIEMADEEMYKNKSKIKSSHIYI